mmetsp:Transcript_67808/g.126668  ORF Transcript_67808/g.126668 Transcript_67808/m.126668 type:complete len:186 (+) Transcript_67808:83-640(+)
MGAGVPKACCVGVSDTDTQQTVVQPKEDMVSGPDLRVKPLDVAAEGEADIGSSQAKEVASSPVEDHQEEAKPPVPVDTASELASIPAGDLMQELVDVTLVKETADEQLFMAVRHLKAQGRLLVLQIQPGGAVERANAVNDAEGRRKIFVGDTIVSVNGIDGDDNELVAECKRCIEMKLRVLPRSA